MKKIAIFGLFLLLVAFVATRDQQAYFSLESLKENQQQLAAYVALHPIGSMLTYVAVYVVLTATSVPGAVFLTLAGGALFGLGVGSALVVFSATTGATLAFLLSRYLLHDLMSRVLGSRLNPINEGVKKDGAYYLFTLRLVPIFPFFLINIAMALTPMKVWTFFWVSFVGMLAGTLVYVNAGTQLAKVSDMSDILSAPMLISLILLGILPLLTKKLSALLNRYR